METKGESTQPHISFVVTVNVYFISSFCDFLTQKVQKIGKNGIVHSKFCSNEWIQHIAKSKISQI